MKNEKNTDAQIKETRGSLLHVRIVFFVVLIMVAMAVYSAVSYSPGWG